MIYCRVEGLEPILAHLDDKRVQAGLRSGMRKVGNKIKTTVSTGIRERYNIKKADLDKRFSASIEPERAVITLKGKHIGLINFINPSSLKMRSVRPKRIGSKISKQGDILKPYVQVKILKAGGYKTLNHAFIATSRGGNFGVFERAGKSRLPIKYLYGPSVAQMANSNEIKDKVQRVFHDDVLTILMHEISFRTGGEY